MYEGCENEVLSPTEDARTSVQEHGNVWMRIEDCAQLTPQES